MGILLQFFVPRYIGKLSNFIEDETFKVFCIKGEMKRLHRWLARINPYLQDAEQRRHHDDTINTWVKELKGVMYDAEDIIDLCTYKGGELLEVHSSASVACCPINLILSCYECAKFRLEIAFRIKGLNARLKEIIEDNNVVSGLVKHKEHVPQDYTVKLPETSPALVKEDIVGTQIEDAADKLIRMILDNDSKRCSVFGIVGMGGIGKTTLAQKIYNDERIKNNFSSNEAWVYVSRNYSDVKLLKQIAKDLGGNDIGAETIAPLETQLISLLSSTRKFFLVLDDVWTADVWSNLLRKVFRNGEASCTILFTSRDVLMGGDMGANYVHPVEFMDEDSGWDLIRKIVFGEDMSIIPEGLEEIGKKIVQKCDRLPLAIKVMGGVLLREEKTRREWERVLESDRWRMNRIVDELPRALYLSYDILPTHLKQCFLSCALYTGISDSQDLVRLWVAEGFIIEQKDGIMEEMAERCYKELVWRNLLQIDTSYAYGNIFSMHDMLRSLGAKLMEDEGITISEGQIINWNSLIKVRRLSLSNKEDSLTLPTVVIQQKCLRVLQLLNSPETKTIKDDVVKGLQCLRVLDICDTSIEALPISIVKLLHLRYLDLDRTNVEELPESIGDLAYLQTLNISGCPSLHRLPNGITRLSNLRCLRAENTPLSHVPKGIGKLTNLNHFEGFVVGQDDSPSAIAEGWNLEELQSLSKLRHLSIWRLDRTSTMEGHSVLANMTCLRRLDVWWTEQEDGEQLNNEQIQNAEKVFNELNPPTSIEHLQMYNFPGGQFPQTIRSTSFPHLEYLTLWYLPLCIVLPPLGQLPRLKYLSIKRAQAIKKIGPEFLGDGNFSTTPAFPKLEYLEFRHMPCWEEWVWSTEQAEEVRDERNHVKLFPHLTECFLQDCSGLRALPEVFSYATNLKSFTLECVDNLSEIENLPFLTDKLDVTKCKNLKRISNLPLLRYMYVEDCSNLESMDNLHALQHLDLICPPKNNQFPQWLSNLLMKEQEGPPSAPQHNIKKFELQCGLPLLKSCLEGKANWPIIKQIPDVKIRTSNGNNFMLCTKGNKPQTNVVDSE